MIVELVGAPGSGKTTITSQVVDAVHADRSVEFDMDLPAGSPAQLMGRMVRATLRTPRFAGQMLPWSVRRGRLELLRALAIEQRIRCVRHLGGAVVVDEGPIHRLLWCMAHFERPVDLRRAARWLPRPDLVVNVPVEPAEAVRRLINRGHVRFVELPSADAALLIGRYQRQARELLGYLGVPVVTPRQLRI